MATEPVPSANERRLRDTLVLSLRFWLIRNEVVERWQAIPAGPATQPAGAMDARARLSIASRRTRRSRPNATADRYRPVVVGEALRAQHSLVDAAVTQSRSRFSSKGLVAARTYA